MFSISLENVFLFYNFAEQVRWVCEAQHCRGGRLPGGGDQPLGRRDVVGEVLVKSRRSRGGLRPKVVVIVKRH